MHLYVCTALCTHVEAEVNIRYLLYSPLPPLFHSFTEKTLQLTPNTAGKGRHGSGNLRDSRVTRAEQWDPAVNSCQVQD